MQAPELTALTGPEHADVLRALTRLLPDAAEPTVASATLDTVPMPTPDSSGAAVVVGAA